MTEQQSLPPNDPGSSIPAAAKLNSKDAIRIVIRRELGTRLRSKSFIIGVAVTVVLVGAAIGIGPLLGGDSPLEIGLVDSEQTSLETSLESSAEATGFTVDITTFDSAEEAEAAVEDGSVDGAVVDGVAVDGVVMENPELIVNREDSDVEILVEAAVSERALVTGLASSGVSLDEVREAAAAQAITVTELEPDPDRDSKQGIAIILPILLFIAIQTTGGYILMGVLEEKGSHIVELILSSIRARDLLIGKVIGLGVVGLIQVVAVAVTAVGVAFLSDSSILPLLNVELIGWGLVWFFVGYITYGALFAAGASLAPRIEDAQSTLAPVTLILMLAYFTSFYVGFNPETRVSEVLSYLPFLSPFLMPGRIALGAVSVAPHLAVLVGNAIFAFLLFRLGERIYVRSVLETGRALKWKEAWSLEK